MSEKIVLIDGHSILNRAFYGVPDLTNSEGIHTNAVYGFLNILFKILDEEHPEYLTVAFDVHHPTFRHEMYPEYKGTRKPMPQELREQVPLIQEMLEAMGVCMVKQPGLEADDILGTIATQAQSRGMDVSLVSGDRDLLQLASDRILIRIPKTKRGGTEIENYHTEQVVEKYGLTPPQIIDLKGLMGDSSDNIPGVAGVGEKTAVKVLSVYPTVEEAYEHLEEITPKRTHDLLEKGRESAFLSKKLATIKTDCKLDFSMEQAKLPQMINEESFAMVKRLEFKSLLGRFSAEDRKTEQLEAQVTVLKTEAQVRKFAAQVVKAAPAVVGFYLIGDPWTSRGAQKKKSRKKEAAQLSFVFEETGVDVAETSQEAEPEYGFHGFSLSYASGAQVVTGQALFSEKLTGAACMPYLREMLECAGRTAVLDLKDMLHLAQPVQEPSEHRQPAVQQLFAQETKQQRQWIGEHVQDLEIGAYLINPLKDSYMADDIARDYLDMTVLSYQESFGKETITGLLEGADDQMREKILSYAAMVSYVCCLAGEPQRKRLEELGMDQLFTEVEMPTCCALYELERVGVRAEYSVLEEMSQMLQGRVEELEKSIYALAGEEFNINSPKQLGVILFEKMHLPGAKKTKTGYSTSADILEKLKNEDEIIPKILEYRQVTKLKSTYADGLPVFIEADHRIHGRFNQTITATGRISSTDPNLQNIPIRMELGRRLRKVFVPQEGCVFLDADYSQIELRVLAHLSGDPGLIEAYQKGQDIHRSTASKVFHTPYDEVTDLQRRNAKAVNFGIVYGISAFGLSQDLDISRKEAQGYIDQYFAMYPAIKSYLEGLVESARNDGVSVTMFGRRRPVPELTSSNFMQRSCGERVAMNAPIQGTAADIIKIAMLRVSERLKKEGLGARVVLQVHDELLVETPQEEVEQVRQILQYEMEHAADLRVPLQVEVEQGANWFEAH